MLAPLPFLLLMITISYNLGGAVLNTELIKHLRRTKMQYKPITFTPQMITNIKMKLTALYRYNLIDFYKYDDDYNL